MALPNYYDVLNISPAATLDEIKRAYRLLARQYHPDLNHYRLDDYMKRLNEAYSVLGDPERRAAYNIQLLAEYQRVIDEASLQMRRERSSPTAGEHMTWGQGAKGFVQELRKELRKGRDPKLDARKMTWSEGAGGFVRELKRELRDE